MERPTREQTLMAQAQIIARRSTCSRSHVGVVIAHEGRVVAQGYNGAPSGMPHCRHDCTCVGSYILETMPANILASGPVIHSPGCAKTSACATSVHAEANAVAFAARYGVATAGASLYTTVSPCVPCAQLIINAGITAVYYYEPYRDLSGVKLLESAGLTLGIIL